MSQFIINNNIPANYNDITTLKKPSQNRTINTIINDFNNDKTRDISRLYEKRSIDRGRDVPKFNDRRNVRKPLDTTAIREDRYDFSVGRYNSGYPRPSNYPLCPQKISTVFQNGGTHFTTSTTTISYPFGHNFLEVADIPRLSSADCGCYYVDFSGNYVLDWSLAGGGKLLSSDNAQVDLGTFTFYQSENYFDIYLYPKPNLNNISYVHIRYRIPIRYRYAYGDWTFWESLIIDNTLSETEFVKIIDCCGAEIDSLQPLVS
jgi:hypothetical protein